MAILEENDLDHYVTSVVEEPTTNAGRTTYKRNQGKARRIIYDSVKENLMPIITPLKTAKECFDTSIKLYETKAPSQNKLLKNQLRTLKIEKDESINPFFTKISQIKDQLLAIGIAVDDDDLVQIAIFGLPQSWETFLSSVNGRDVQPSFERLWHDCLQEESRILGRNGPRCKDEGKKFTPQKRGLKPKGPSNKSKIICYNCQKPDHYARNCQQCGGRFKRKRFHASAADTKKEPANKRQKQSTNEQEEKRP